MTNKHRLLKLFILTLFVGVLQSQTNTIKFKKNDGSAVNFSLAKMNTGFITIDELISDPIIRLETKKIMSIKTCEITLGINGKVYTFRAGNCTELTAEQILIIESAEVQYRNRLFIDAIALDEKKKEVPLKSIALTIVTETDPE